MIPILITDLYRLSYFFVRRRLISSQMLAWREIPYGSAEKAHKRLLRSLILNHSNRVSLRIAGFLAAKGPCAKSSSIAHGEKIVLVQSTPTPLRCPSGRRCSWPRPRPGDDSPNSAEKPLASTSARPASLKSSLGRRCSVRKTPLL